MILGAVLAGGKSSRFGSDKALAELDGASLMQRAVTRLGLWCDEVVIVGRTSGTETGTARCIPDWPQADMGPLGGIAAALLHAQKTGAISVLTCGVDSANLPDNLLHALSPAPAYLEKQPVIGHWNSSAASIVQAILQSEGRRSMIAFATAANARGVEVSELPANINTPADLAMLQAAEMEQNHGI